MRFSARKDDPGYRNYRKAFRRASIVVRVDGAVVGNCFTADTKRGLAVVADLNESGRVQLDAWRRDVKMKQLHGRVTIEFERRA